MNEWFRESWENSTGRNRWYSSSYYNAATGELNLYSLFGLISFAGGIFNFYNYIEHRELFVSVLIAIFPLGLGIAGLIMSFRELPYALNRKSLYRVIACMAGVAFSLLGLLFTIGLVVILFLPPEMLSSIAEALPSTADLSM